MEAEKLWVDINPLTYQSTPKIQENKKKYEILFHTGLGKTEIKKNYFVFLASA